MISAGSCNQKSPLIGIQLEAIYAWTHWSPSIDQCLLGSAVPVISGCRYNLEYTQVTRLISSLFLTLWCFTVRFPWYFYKWRSPQPRQCVKRVGAAAAPGRALWGATLGTSPAVDQAEEILSNLSICILMDDDLVGGLEHFLFSHILGIIIPID